MESKIQPGQKLSEGDYCYPMTKDQFNELIAIENDKIRLEFDEGDGITFELYLEDPFLGFFDAKRSKVEYSFPDFKQLCINTFKDGE